MIPVYFEGSNVVMGKPSDMTDEQCGSLHAMRGVDADGFPFFDECWKPSEEEIKEIVSGKAIRIRILSKTLPPIAVWVND